jgi:hypothetical protein
MVARIITVAAQVMSVSLLAMDACAATVAAVLHEERMATSGHKADTTITGANESTPPDLHVAVWACVGMQC